MSYGIADQAERSAQEEELRSQQRRMELAQALQSQVQQQGFAQNSGGLGVLGMAAQGLANGQFGKDLKGLFAGGGLV